MASVVSIGVKMPITMELRENNRVFYYRVTYPSHLSELAPLREQVQAIRDQYPHRIHVIANLTEVRTVPADILSLRRDNPNLNHPRAGLVFIVTPSSYIRSIAAIIAHLTNTDKLRMVTIEEEAWTAVRKLIESEVDAPLPTD